MPATIGDSLRALIFATGGSMTDVLYIGLTIVVFGVLWLVVRGIETFER
jgi:hypothetical protein